MFCGCFRGTYVQLPSVRVRFQIYTGVPSRRGRGRGRWVGPRARAMPAPRAPGGGQETHDGDAQHQRTVRVAPLGGRARRCAAPRQRYVSAAYHASAAAPAPRPPRRPSRARCRRCARRRPRQRPPGGRPREPVHERALVGEVQLRFDLLARERLLEHAAEVAVAAGAQSASARGATTVRGWAPQPGRAAAGATPRGEASPQALDGRAARGRGGLGRRRSDAPEAPVARIEGASAGSSTQ